MALESAAIFISEDHARGRGLFEPYEQIVCVPTAPLTHRAHVQLASTCFIVASASFMIRDRGWRSVCYGRLLLQHRVRCASPLRGPEWISGRVTHHTFCSTVRQSPFDIQKLSSTFIWTRNDHLATSIRSWSLAASSCTCISSLVTPSRSAESVIQQHVAREASEIATRKTEGGQIGGDDKILQRDIVWTCFTP